MAISCTGAHRTKSVERILKSILANSFINYSATIIIGYFTYYLNEAFFRSNYWEMTACRFSNFSLFAG